MDGGPGVDATDWRRDRIVIDLAKALAERMHQPVEIRLMNWAEAQRLVLDGQADALLQINPSPERLKTYDFSEPLLTSQFTIFTSAEHVGIFFMSDLRGLKVGVEKQGLPLSLLQKDSQIIVEIIPDFVQGFRMLETGALDVVVADRWVGSYVLAENKIRGVKLIEEPISLSHSAIAVKKGNTNLLGDINAALADIRRDGTYDKIIKLWRSKEIVFETREQVRQRAWLFAAITAILILALAGVALLVREVQKRKHVEATLRESKAQLDLALQSASMGAWHWDLVEDRRYFDDQVCYLLGIEPAKFTGTAASRLTTGLSKSTRPTNGSQELRRRTSKAAESQKCSQASRVTRLITSGSMARSRWKAAKLSSKSFSKPPDSISQFMPTALCRANLPPSSLT
jgi:ABC-type amino acid transport substrate-binding protein